MGHALASLPAGPGPENMFTSPHLQRSLTSLNLSSNGLTALPPEICQLGHLRHLNLLRNKLTHLPRIGDLGRSLQSSTSAATGWSSFPSLLAT